MGGEGRMGLNGGYWTPIKWREKNIDLVFKKLI